MLYENSVIRKLLYYSPANILPHPCSLVDPDKVYLEFAIPSGVTLRFLTVQVRVKDMDGVTWISEGIGQSILFILSLTNTSVLCLT